MSSKGSSVEGANEDRIIVIPIQTALRRILNRTYLNRIFVKVKSIEIMNQAENEIEYILRSRHKLNLRGKENDFTIDNKLNALNAQKESSRVLEWLIIGVAAISLAVGGIGVLAVMLLSIRERTGEIGLRVSVGARKKDIIWQFLSEASMLSVSGGIIGIFSGILLAWITGVATQWPTYISVNSIIISVIISITIGLVFGVSPALKATRLDPVEALRKE